MAAGPRDTPESVVAREELCRTYWYPLYAYVRRWSYSPEDAEDLTQEFFFRLLRKNYLGQVDPGKGKFRSFLLAAMNHFLANEWHRERRVKRGGDVDFITLDGVEQLLPSHLAARSPEQVYERCWTLALLQQVLSMLREECTKPGRPTHFEDLKNFLTAEEPPVGYAELAAKHGTNEAALRKEVQRLRQRYSELLREELLRTVGSPFEVEDELCYLFSVLAG